MCEISSRSEENTTTSFTTKAALDDDEQNQYSAETHAFFAGAAVEEVGVTDGVVEERL